STRAWWTADSHPRENANATPSSVEGDVQYVPGVSDQAFNFLAGSLLLPQSNWFNFTPSKDFTIDLWFRRTDPAPLQYIMGRGAGCSSSPSELQLTISPNGFPASTIAMNAWSHLALTVSGGVAEFYVNGARVNRRPMVIQDVSASWRIGGVGSCPRTGSMIDEVVFTDKILLQSEFHELIDRKANQRCKNEIKAVVNAASQRSGSSPFSIVSIFGLDLAGRMQQVNGPPVSALDGISAVLRGTIRETVAKVYFTSPNQVNVLVPDVPPSSDTVLILNRIGYAPKAFPLQISAVAPGIFTANGDGRGAPAGSLATYSLTGQSDEQPLFVANVATGLFDPRPVAMPATGSAYLILYGTGLRNRRTVNASLGGEQVDVQFLGAQPQFDGLDQINLGPLPLTLRGRGTVTLALTVDGTEANPTTISFR
ncbi:MAG: LamG-like jellyroll fold domain-containing protein, partial [Planctomycetota bacterium]|nr:LamG-like jellyroll fold domain-containing protein [Planctomycetota bacterium]